MWRKASNTDNIAIGTYSEALTSGQDAYALAVGSYSKANAHMAVGVGALANATSTGIWQLFGAGSKATAKTLKLLVLVTLHLVKMLQLLVMAIPLR